MTEPTEPKSPEAKAMVAYHQLKSRKGWTEGSLLTLLYEFIVKQGQVGELVTFLKERK